MESSIVMFTDPKNACKKLHENLPSEHTFISGEPAWHSYMISQRSTSPQSGNNASKNTISLIALIGTQWMPYTGREVNNSFKWWLMAVVRRRRSHFNNLVFSAEVGKVKKYAKGVEWLYKPMYRRLSYRMRIVKSPNFWVEQGSSVKLHKHPKLHQFSSLIENK